MGETERERSREPGGGRGESKPAPWNLNKTSPHRKHRPQNSNRKLAPDSEY